MRVQCKDTTLASYEKIGREPSLTTQNWDSMRFCYGCWRLRICELIRRLYRDRMGAFL